MLDYYDLDGNPIGAEAYYAIAARKHEARAKIEWHGDKGYATCQICGKLVQVNKPLVGSLHVCLTDEEARIVEDDPTRIGSDTIGEAWVSTVWLGLNHNYGDGPPLIFESMVFGGPYTEHCWRWSTREAALAGHDRIVAALRNGTSPDEESDQ